MARRVYFAFHYQDVIDFRANVVRNHGAIIGSDKAGYFDASIWESTKKTSYLALKRMINSELENTSVTTVLIGSQTFARPWVRYEICKSLERENKLIGIHINRIKGRDSQTKPNGSNPFDYLALASNGNNSYRILEFNGGEWIPYSHLGSFSRTGIQGVSVSKSIRFSAFSDIKVFDWVGDNGVANFSGWIG